MHGLVSYIWLSNLDLGFKDLSKFRSSIGFSKWCLQFQSECYLPTTTASPCGTHRTPGSILRQRCVQPWPCMGCCPEVPTGWNSTISCNLQRGVWDQTDKGAMDSSTDSLSTQSTRPFVDAFASTPRLKEAPRLLHFLRNFCSFM